MWTQGLMTRPEPESKHFNRWEPHEHHTIIITPIHRRGNCAEHVTQLVTWDWDLTPGQLSPAGALSFGQRQLSLIIYHRWSLPL